jgi:hypothetical protein
MNISVEDLKAKLFSNEHLPEGLVVEGYLNLVGCTALTHLPEGLVIKGHLDLWRCSSLTYLPEKLVVNGWLDLVGCTSLTHLPAGLVVEGYILCHENLIDSIPFEDLPIYVKYNFKDHIHEHLTRRLQP